MGVKRIETVFPELTVEIDPSPSFSKRLAIERQQVNASRNAPGDEACMLQDPDVLRGRGERDRERLRELSHPHRALAEGAEHLSPDGMAQSRKCRVQGGFIFNHRVE